MSNNIFSGAPRLNGFTRSHILDLIIQNELKFNSDGDTNLYKMSEDSNGNLIIEFQTSSGDTTFWTLDSNGRVGIGATPAFNLDIQDTANTQIRLLRESGTEMRLKSQTTQCRLTYDGTAGTFLIDNDDSGTNVITCEADGDVLVTNNLGVGGTPTTNLYVVGTGTVTSEVESTTGNALLRITSIATGNSSVFFGDADGNVGQISYDHTSDFMSFRVNDAVRMTITSGGNVIVGSTATAPTISLAIGDSDTGLDQISDGIVTVVTNSAERMRFNAGTNGSIIIQTGTSATNIFQESSTATAQVLSIRRSRDNDTQRYTNFFKDSTSTSGTTVGRIEDIASTLTLTSASDSRLKENVTEYTGGYEVVKALEAKTFDWIGDEENVSKNCRGFIAQDFLVDCPRCVTTGFTRIINEEVVDCYGMSQQKLIPELWSCCRLLIARVELLEARVRVLEGG